MKVEERDNEGHGTLFVKIVCEVLQNQVELYREKDITFYLERKESIFEVISPSMTTMFSIIATRK